MAPQPTEARPRLSTQAAATPTATKPPPVPTTIPDSAAAPCRPGQIKGNRDSHIYHLPGQQNYARTRADVVCFNTEAEAQAAGFRKALR